MPTRTDINNWKPEKLSEWATELETDTQFYETQLGQILTHFTGTSWSGKAHDAASDRFTEEHDQGRKLSQEIRDVAAALRAADQRLANEKRLLLGKVSDAENDLESPIPLTVSDKWVVSCTGIGAHLSADDRKKAIDKVHAHQALINTAYHSLVGAVSEVSAAITTATQEIRVRGDQLGDGIDAPTAAPADSGVLGKEDGQAVAAAIRPDGTVDPAVLDQIASRLPQGILTENDMQILANGGELSTVPASTQQYYREFFQGAGKDGVLALSEHLKTQEAAGNPVAAARRDALANGLLVVSNEKIGTGRDSNGKLQSPGGYEALPQDMRDLVSGRWNEYADLSTTGDQPKKFAELTQLGDLVAQADPDIPPGKTMGVEMSRQAASMVDYFDSFGESWPPGYTEDDEKAIENGASNLLSVGARNFEANAALLSGEGLPEVAGPSPAAGEYKPQPFNRDEFAATVFGREWSDDGKAAAQLFDWTATESHETGPDGKLTEQAILARRTIAELPEVFTPMHDPDSPDGAPSVHRGGLQIDADAFKNNAKMFAANPEMSNALAQVMGSNIDTYARDFGNTAFLEGSNETQLETIEANRLLFLASQSDQGRMTLEVSRQLYESNLLTEALRTGDGKVPSDFTQQFNAVAHLDGRITNAAENAMTFQDQNQIKTYNDHQVSIYETRKAAAQFVADSTIGLIEVPATAPGGPVAGQVADVLKDKATEAAIDSFVPKPELMEVRYPNITEINAQAARDFKQEILNSAFNADHPIPPELMNPYTGKPINVTEEGIGSSLPTTTHEALDEFIRNAGLAQVTTDYDQTHGIEVLQGAGKDSTSLDIILTGRKTEE
ncbi:hypothetical protein GV791_17005 [Nocardia cyriacigeorgica]|uniref:TPR repeat domain-containing protein n=1 Tax=Nocardia cyriacigeorgica TaxID=135487 RepID=A0A6P1CVT0_9NOCA|nr:hypothetical protein [Nocardia cyriacigeorgica]MBF6424950.1 hypothetical protein [Nocardia cyriacigeorgica]NEW34245.1 hypothetical protein [Nocardia cyriacigeorgica]